MPRHNVKLDYEANERIRAASLSNAELLLFTVTLSAGDDWEGCFTEEGKITFYVFKEELQKRLLDAKWLDEEIW